MSLIGVGLYLVITQMRAPGGYFSRAVEKEQVQFNISTEGMVAITPEMQNHHLAVSPDGRYLAFVVLKGGKRMLWLRPRDGVSVRSLAGTENGSSPFWSPDSRWIGFFADGVVKKININGGPVQTLCAAPLDNGTGTWSRGGIILFGGDHLTYTRSRGAAWVMSKRSCHREEFSGRMTGLRIGASFCTKSLMCAASQICGFCRCSENESPSRFATLNFSRPKVGSRRTADGLPTCRTSQGNARFMFSLFSSRAMETEGDGAFRRMAARNQCGEVTGKNSFTWLRITADVSAGEKRSHLRR